MEKAKDQLIVKLRKEIISLKNAPPASASRASRVTKQEIEALNIYSEVRNRTPGSTRRRKTTHRKTPWLTFLRRINKSQGTIEIILLMTFRISGQV